MGCDCEQLVQLVVFLVVIAILGSPVALLYCLLYGLLDPQLQAATGQTEVNVDGLLLLSQLITAVVLTLIKICIPSLCYRRLAMLLFMVLGLGLGIVLFTGRSNLGGAVFCGGVAVMMIQVIFPSFLPTDTDDDTMTNFVSIYGLCLDGLLTFFSGIFQSVLLHERMGSDGPSIAGYKGPEYLSTIFIIYCVFAGIAVLFSVGILIYTWKNDDGGDEDVGQFSFLQMTAVIVLSMSQALPMGSEDPESMAFIYVAGAQIAIFGVSKLIGYFCSCGAEKFDLIYEICSIIGGIVVVAIAIALKQITVLAGFQAFESKLFFDTFDEGSPMSYGAHFAFLAGQAISAYVISQRDIDMQLFLASSQSGCAEIKSVVGSMGIFFAVVFALQVAFVIAAKFVDFSEIFLIAVLVSGGIGVVGVAVAGGFTGAMLKKLPVAEVTALEFGVSVPKTCPGGADNPAGGFTYYQGPEFEIFSGSTSEKYPTWTAKVENQNLQAEAFLMYAYCALIACALTVFVLATLTTALIICGKCEERRQARAQAPEETKVEKLSTAAVTQSLVE